MLYVPYFISLIIIEYSDPERNVLAAEFSGLPLILSFILAMVLKLIKQDRFNLLVPLIAVFSYTIIMLFAYDNKIDEWMFTEDLEYHNF
jgi:hypothetical protein